MTTTDQPEATRLTPRVDEAVALSDLEDEPSTTDDGHSDLFRYNPKYGHADLPETD